MSGVASTDDGVIVSAFGILGKLRPPRRRGGLTSILISLRPGDRRKRIFALLVIRVASTDDGVIVSAFCFSHYSITPVYSGDEQPRTKFEHV